MSKFAIGDRVVPTIEATEAYNTGTPEDDVVVQRQVFVIEESSGVAYPYETHPEDGPFENLLYVFDEDELEAFNE